jgi:sugar lactone lactonase YvrE
MKLPSAFLNIFFILLVVPPALADGYADARAELVAAYQAQDFDAMVDAANKSLQVRPGYPGALFNLALAQALSGNPKASFATLNSLLDRGVDFGADEMDEFAALRELPQWDAYRTAVETLYVPVGAAEVALQLDIDRFVPEGIAFDSDGVAYLGSIHKGQLIRATAEPQVLSDRAGHWSVFGMRFHDDGSLWFASAAVQQMDGVNDEAGETGLFRFDIGSGELTHSAILPELADKQLLGDLVISRNTILTTDSLAGAVYRYDIDTKEYSAIVRPGEMGSPQGLALDASRDFLYVADYIGGLYRLSLGDGSRIKLAIPDTITDYGIDGLYLHGGELIAIQNGIRPHRVVALQLSDDGLGIASGRTLASGLPEFDEPTLGVVRGGDFYFVANSHWNRFDAEGRLPDGLSGPIILKVRLTPH